MFNLVKRIIYVWDEKLERKIAINNLCRIKIRNNVRYVHINFNVNRLN